MTTVSQTPAAAGPDRLYHMAWRWHFYAGLYVVPFLMMLAVTGLIMLWTAATTEVNGERSRVPVGVAALPVSQLQAAAEAAVPGGAASRYVAPMAPDRVALFRVDAGEAATAVLVDPYTGAVTDSFAWGAGPYALASDIHGTLLLGNTGDWLIEAAASLGILLVVSGIYLHWPRQGGWRQALLPRLTGGRAAWKALHGAVGLWMSVVMLVFLISGLSWAGVWGAKIVQAWSTFPAAKWDAVPLSDATHAAMNHGAEKDVPWALEQTPMPASGSLAGTAAVPAPVTVDGVARFAAGLGFQGRFQIAWPDGETGVWTVSHDSMSNDGPDPTADRTLHIDRYSGNVLADVGFADYAAYARAMAVGIAFHEGDMGAWNVALNTIFCLAMILLPVSGVVMWWKRRPARAGRLAAPPRPRDLPSWRRAAGVAAVLCLAFPMAGVAVVAVILIDRTVLRLLPPLRRALS